MIKGRTHLDYLRDIPQMMDEIGVFNGGYDFDEFVADHKTYMAVVQAIQIIGEASKQVPLRVRRSYPNVPWKQMAGMRDKLIHVCFGTDASIVWETATGLIPALRPLVAEALEKETRNA
jgi:uncharacterized protein with HEPN domain